MNKALFWLVPAVSKEERVGKIYAAIGPPEGWVWSASGAAMSRGRAGVTGSIFGACLWGRLRAKHEKREREESCVNILVAVAV